MYDITYTHKTYAGSSRPIRHTNSQRAVRATPMSRQRLPSMRRSWSRPHDDARAQTSQTSMRRVPHAWDARVSVTYASKRQAHHGTLRAMIAGYSFESRWFQRIEGTARAQGTKTKIRSSSFRRTVSEFPGTDELFTAKNRTYTDKRHVRTSMMRIMRLLEDKGLRWHRLYTPCIRIAPDSRHSYAIKRWKFWDRCKIVGELDIGTQTHSHMHSCKSRVAC